jgi:N-acyl-D-aspartate/D-glutamate deacylase
MREKIHRRTYERQGNPALLVLSGFFVVTVLYCGNCTIGTKYCTDHRVARPARGLGIEAHQKLR